MLPQELMEILCCPQCHGRLQEIASPSGLHCGTCRLFYPIEDGIPNMLVEEAHPDSVMENKAPNLG